MQWTGYAFAGLAAMGLAGCQCCSVTERYQDHIDHIADHQPHLDKYYHAGLDLTRIGYPDWCQSPLNRKIYGNQCCRDTRRQPAYDHNPFFDASTIRERKAPALEENQIAPRIDTGPDASGTDPVPTQLRGVPDSPKLEKGDRMPALPRLPPSSGTAVPPAPNSPVPESLTPPPLPPADSN